MRKRGTTGVAAAIALLLAGCPGPQGNKKNTALSDNTTAGTSVGSGKVAVRIDTPSRHYRPWQVGKASLVIENQSEHPIVIRQALLSTSGGTAIIDESTVQRFPCAVTVDAVSGKFADTLAIEGAYLEDDPGAAARAPSPPRWEFRGDGELVTFSVLPPGARRLWMGTFRARYQDGETLSARVRFSAIDDGKLDYYRKDSDSAEDVSHERQPAMGTGMTDRLHVKAIYRKANGAFDGSGEATPPSVQTLIPFAPFALALPAQAFDALASEQTEATTPLAIEHFPFDIDAARSAAGLASGPYTRAVAAEMWVLSGDGFSYLVSAERVVKARGNAIPLADALNENRKQTLTLYRGAGKPDEKGHLAYFREQGFRASEIREKDGSYTGRLVLDARQLPAFLQSLEARGLAMKDADEVE